MPRSSFLNIKNVESLKRAPERKQIPSQGFFMNFGKNYQNTCFIDHLFVIASSVLKWQVV